MVVQCELPSKNLMVETELSSNLMLIKLGPDNYDASSKYIEKKVIVHLFFEYIFNDI